MKSFKQFQTNLTEGNNMKAYAKKILTVAWAKDQHKKEKFDRVLTNAGDDSGLQPQRSPADLVAGKPPLVSKKGMANFRARLKSVYSMDVGVNIADQTVDYLDDVQVLKIINNFMKASKSQSRIMG